MPTENTPPQPETARILDIGDGRMLGQLPSGEKLWLSGPTVPGDHVTFLREGQGGRLLDIREPAPNRIPAPCPHFDACPGCTLQPLPYPEQCRLKADKIIQTLRRIGGFHNLDFHGLRPSPDPHGTRNKLDLHVRGPDIGYTDGANLIPIQDCLMGTSLVRETLAHLRPTLQDPHGIHRLMIRSDTAGEHAHVRLRGDPLPQSLLDAARNHPSIAGLSHQPAPREPIRLLHGTPHLRMKLADVEHLVSFDTFFQVHDAQADALVRAAMDLIAQAPPGNLLDLFSGIGAFTLPAARISHHVLGVDTHPGEGPFLPANLSKGLPNHPKIRNTPWDTVLVDPPRAGMAKSLCRTIRDKLKPQRILYISCNPATLARDLARLCANNAYHIHHLEGFDLFPQTTHVETLVLLKQA